MMLFPRLATLLNRRNIGILNYPLLRLVKDSGLFDSNYYLQKYPDIGANNLEPLQHFMDHGAFEGRDPNPWFYSKWYTWHYPDVARTRQNPLLHYLLHGAKEGRDPSPWFNTIEYLLSHPGLAEANINPLAHYIASGTATIPDQLQSQLIMQSNAGRVVQSRELTDLIDFPPRDLRPTETTYTPSSLDIHWIIPDFAPGGGGHMTIFRIVRLLEQFGHRCTIWITRSIANRNERSADEMAVRHYQTIKADIKFLSSEFFSQSGDAIICTSWETVVFGMHATGFKDRLYFVQDYEPAFFATGAHSLASEWTYQNDIGCICASPWLAEKLERIHGRWTKAGWLAVDLDIYKPLGGIRDPAEVPRVAFYARRHSERRAVDLGLLALEDLAKRGVRFHVEFFGMHLGIGHLPYPYTDNGVLNETELARLYQRCDVGIVFSSTNYSLVPQEMMASRLAVLELDGESTRRIYPKKIITLAGPHPLDIAEKLKALLENHKLRAAQARAALTWVRQFSWEQFARVVEGAILERLQAKGFSAALPAPFIAKEPPKASILIPTYNGGKIFQKVLRAIQMQRAPWPFEIIVIDSNSSDGTAEFAAASEGVVFRSIPKHEFQHGRTRNLGIDMASGEYVSIVTQDALPFNESWLYNMITVMDKFPYAAGAFGRHITYPEASPFLERDMTNHFASFEPHPIAVSKYTNYKTWLSGDVGWRQFLHFYSDNNSCLRKSVWRSIPYPNVEYGEDQVWAARIIEAGFEKLYVKSATVYHSHNYTPNELFDVSRQQGRFFKKYFGYDCAPPADQLDGHIANMNANDVQWASANGVAEGWVAPQCLLNAARIRGMWTGMVSTAYIGYERDPIADAAE
jgi:glycosyltransferase involved in cell wall biosynthesis